MDIRHNLLASYNSSLNINTNNSKEIITNDIIENGNYLDYIIKINKKTPLSYFKNTN